MSSIISQIFTVYYWIVIARVILSWVRIGYDSPFRPVVNIIHQLTEPLLGPIRKVIPSGMGLDFSPIILLFGLQFLQRFLLGLF